MLGGGTPQRPLLQQRFKEAGGDRMSLSDDLADELQLAFGHRSNHVCSYFR